MSNNTEPTPVEMQDDPQATPESLEEETEIKAESDGEFSVEEETKKIDGQAVLQGQYLRLCAEFENYKKRVDKEKKQWITQTNKQLLLTLLPIIDAFEMAISHVKGELPESQKGFMLIYEKLLQVIKAQELKVMEMSAGDPFDANRHEALSTIPTEEAAKKNTIFQIVNKGYTLNNQIVRFAKVIVYI